MRFLLCVMSTVAVLLTGCVKTNNASSLTQAAYESYYNAVEENDKFASSSLYYTVNAEISRLSDGTYRYYIFVDQPQVAMYDIVLFAVENDQSLSSSTKMMPSIGIFGDSRYSMIPFQSYTAKDFVKGLVISGETEQSSVDIELLVEWKDKTKENVRREFLAFTIDRNGFHSDQLPEEETEEQEDGEAVNE